MFNWKLDNPYYHSLHLADISNFFPVKSIDWICFQHLVRSRLDTSLRQSQWSNLSAGWGGKSEKDHSWDKISILSVYKHCSILMTWKLWNCRRSKFQIVHSYTCNCYRCNLIRCSQSMVFLQTYYLLVNFSNVLF